MERILFVMTLLGSMLLTAQSPEDIQKDFFAHLKTDALILADEGLIKGDSNIKNFISEFEASNGKEHTYKKDFNIKVNAHLDYEIGEIQTNDKAFTVMFLKIKGSEIGAKIEFLIIYEKSNSENELSDIDKSRKDWMALCNAHQVEKLVKQLYVADAYYYNRGRLLQGTKALSSEYSYMNSPNYSLKLTPKHVIFVNSDIAFELGQCSGSYPLPYMLVWEKQDDGKWLILMDSNF